MRKIVAKITLDNRIGIIQAHPESINYLCKFFTVMDTSMCWQRGKFVKELAKPVCFITRSESDPTGAMIPIGLVPTLDKILNKADASYKINDQRKDEVFEVKDSVLATMLLTDDNPIELRDYQIGALYAMFDNKNGVIKAGTGAGKCLAKGTKILMFNGSIKNVEDVVSGDQIMGPDSKPRNVLSTTTGREMMYDIIPTKGNKYTVNESHILSLKLTGKDRYHHRADNGIIDISIKDYIKESNKFKHYTKGYRVGIDWDEQTLPSHIDPYFLGLWLGDGSSSNPAIHTVDIEIIEYLKSHAVEKSMRLYEDVGLNMSSYRFTSINGRLDGGRGNHSNIMLNQMRDLDLIKNKHIPEIYKINNRINRLQLLAGLIDSDGSLDNNCFDYLSKIQELANDVAFVARSVGLAAYVKECKKSATNGKPGNIGTYYRVSISGNVDMIPTKIKRKQGSRRQQAKNVLVTGIKVKSIGEGNYYGFQIDGDRRFVLGDFTVTHNTEIFNAWCKYTNKKTLIFFKNIKLANDTRKRMIKAGMDAGIVQGKNIDENHQIVMATVQSAHKLQRTDYEAVIVDECFTNNTQVHTENGLKPISKLCSTKSTENVYSFNPSMNKFELKPISNWYIKKTDKIVTVEFNGKSRINCTPNHPFYKEGYIKIAAENLQVGDKIILKPNYKVSNSHTPVLSREQYQAVLGMVLGDGNIQKTKNLARLRFTHGEKQLDYLNYKKTILENQIYQNNAIGKSGYSDNKIYTCNTLCSNDYREIYNKFYINGKKIITKELLDELDEISLAFWFMDDGYYCKHENITGYYELATHSFKENENILISNVLKEKFDIDSKLKFDKRCNKFYLVFKTKSTEKIAKLIFRYIPKSMQYKLPVDFKNRFEFNPEIKNYSVLKVKNIKTKNIKSQNVYNITVDDHHNYLVGAGYLVGNCHNASQDRYQEVLKRWDFEYRYGFSATPFNKKNKLKMYKVKAWLGDEICNIPAAHLIEQGYLAKPIITFINVDKVINNVKRQKTIKLVDEDGEFLRDEEGKICKQKKIWYEKVEKTLEPDAQWMTVERSAIVHNIYRNKMIKTLANNLKGTVLALVKYVETHGEKLHQEMNDALFLSGKDKLKERDLAVEMLENNEIKTIIASTIFDEGISIDNISNVIMCGGGQSYEKTLQRIGRGMRILRDEEGNVLKDVVKVYDFYDTTHPILEKHSKERVKYAKAEGYEVKIKHI